VVRKTKEKMRRMVVRMVGAARTAVVVMVVKMLLLGEKKRLTGEKKEKGMENENEGVKLPNYHSNSHQNYCFTHGVVFVSKILCLLIISLCDNYQDNNVWRAFS